WSPGCGLLCCCPTSSLSGHCYCCPSHHQLRAPLPPPPEPHQPQPAPPVPGEAPQPHVMCVCGSGHLHQADPLGSRDLVGKSCQALHPLPPHQALRRAHPPRSTLGLLCGAPPCLERMGGDPNSANPGFLDYGFAAPHGLATPHPNSDSMRGDGDGLILGEAPATLRPFLFGGRGEGVDPQLYVTITISIIIVLVATGIIFKFCWDRSQKRRRPSGQQGALRQEESQQPLTDLSPAGVTVLGAFGDSPTPTPDHEEPRGGPRPGMSQPKGAPAFQLNR
ncbi:PILR alpha-associated neural protein isoform b precursor, partial [Daubentonia madagascariensis]